MTDITLALQNQTRAFAIPTNPDLQLVSPAANTRAESLVAQAQPERVEIVRQGSSWAAAIPTGSAFTYVAAWPTTRAELVLFNGEPSNGKSYVLDRAWMANVSSMAAAQPIALLFQLAPANNAVAAPTNNTGILKWSLSGYQNVYNGNAKLAVANTAFALTNLWCTIGQSIMAAMTTNIGSAVEADLKGRYIVPPGACACFAGLSDTAAGTAIIGVEWHEELISVH